MTISGCRPAVNWMGISPFWTTTTTAISIWRLQVVRCSRSIWRLFSSMKMADSVLSRTKYSWRAWPTARPHGLITIGTVVRICSFPEPTSSASGERYSTRTRGRSVRIFNLNPPRFSMLRRSPVIMRISAGDRAQTVMDPILDTTYASEPNPEPAIFFPGLPPRV